MRAPHEQMNRVIARVAREREERRQLGLDGALAPTTLPPQQHAPRTTTVPDVHAALKTLLLGTADAGSPLCKLSGHHDELEHVASFARRAWAHTLLESAIVQEPVAFAHVDNVDFPEPRGLKVNMMPFVMGDMNSLPEELHGYWNMIQRCVMSLYPSPQSVATHVGYLTVHESTVCDGEAQRRPGLHTEGFTQEACEPGKIHSLPRWHPWGFGRSMGVGKFEGGIFLASTVSDSCHVYNAIIPRELVGRGGEVEHLRDELRGYFSEPPKPRTRWPDDPGRYGSHANCARCHAHMEGDNVFEQMRVKRPVSLQAGELVWMTDRTPHESVPLQGDGTGAPLRRQFFRLVAGPIDMWYAAHSTPNPLGTAPEARVVSHDKFTGEEPEPGPHPA